MFSKAGELSWTGSFSLFGINFLFFFYVRLFIRVFGMFVASSRLGRWERDSSFFGIVRLVGRVLLGCDFW